MRQRNKVSVFLPVPVSVLVLALVFLFWTGPGFAASWDVLVPLDQVDQVPIGKAGKLYLTVGDKGIKVPVTGPGVITGYARIAFPPGEEGKVDGLLEFSGVPRMEAQKIMVFSPSRKSTWGDDRPGKPSGGHKFTIEVPEGEFLLELAGFLPGGDPMLIILYYEGPPQPHLAVAKDQAKGERTTKKKAKPAVTFLGHAAIDIIYNDNILTNSPGYNDDFISGTYPWKFINGTVDDLIIAPSFDIEGRSRLVPWGQSRLKFKVKYWRYARNPIKTNTDFHFYFRQYFGKSQSLELYFHFAPEQYIRQLSDRSPLSDREDEIDWTQFRFQRNVWNATWRQRFSKKFSAKVLYEENYRYYNQPFMENDISAWEVRGNLTWKLSRVLTWNFDYSYEDAQGRAIDSVWEIPENSNNSDPSYERDLYRIGLDIRHSALKKVVDRVGLSFLFMDYYYPTTKTLVEDPYHAGRRDMFYKGTVELRKRISKPLTLKLAVRRTERVVDSPWEGDITTDKDFTQWLYWTSLNYRF
ncbi:MAG: hypothetical protein DRP71_13630 [Verrucomicrobia bacterium]|nr:MAG: hypothetical protein DRP71_13630 [Verrucomicrobiota bacterium]